MANDALSGRLTASGGVPKARTPKPLRLGAEGVVHLEATASAERAFLRGPHGAHVELTKRGGGVLGRWLLDWARPRARIKLWSVSGIAQECGVSRGTVHNWRRARSFPKPIPVVGGADVWEAAAVKAWLRLERPTPGRPRAK